MTYLINSVLLFAEATVYFSVMAALFRMRRRFGIGMFFCALGTMHFLETYLASILYLQFPWGIVISPGSVVLFSQTCPLIAQDDTVVDRYAEAFRRVWEQRDALVEWASQTPS